MGKCRIFMRLTLAEAAAIQAFIRKPPSAPARLRAQAIWFSSQGHPVKEIAKLLAVTERSVWNWFEAYRTGGLDGLRDKPIPGRRPSLNSQQEAELVAITRQSPASVGMSGYTWNCRLLSEWMGESFHLHLSDEWVRQILLKHGLRFRRPKLVLTSPDPAYTQKKRRLTG